MTALDNLTAAFNDVRAVISLGVAKIRQLAEDLAVARATAADAVVIDQIANELHATADQLRMALAMADQSPPPA